MTAQLRTPAREHGVPMPWRKMDHTRSAPAPLAPPPPLELLERRWSSPFTIELKIDVVLRDNAFLLMGGRTDFLCVNTPAMDNIT